MDDRIVVTKIPKITHISVRGTSASGKLKTVTAQLCFLSDALVCIGMRQYIVLILLCEYILVIDIFPI